MDDRNEYQNKIYNQQEDPINDIWGRSRIMVVGEDRAGKTSFCMCMKGELVTESNKTASGRITESNMKFYDINGKKEGIFLVSENNDIEKPNLQNEDSSSDDENENNAASMAKEIIILDRSQNFDLSVDFIDKSFTQPEIHASESEDSYIDTYEMLSENDRNDVIEVIETVEDEKEELPTAYPFKNLAVSVIDYGGHNKFHGYLHLFIKPYGVYCVLFNMEKFLYNEVNTLYNIRYWINSIIFHTRNQKDGDQESVNVPIIIVGTHRDKLPSFSDIIKISTKLLDALKDSSGIRNIIKYPGTLINDNSKFDSLFFPINNTVDNQKDLVFQELMIHIFRSLCTSTYVNKLSNFEHYRILNKINKNYYKVNILQTTILISFIDNNINSRDRIEAESILFYFIKKGLFFSHHSKIVLQADKFLINLITKIIYDPSDHQSERKSKYQWDRKLKILLKKGVARDKFIRKLLDGKFDKKQENGDAGTAESGKQEKVFELDFIIEFMLHNNLMVKIPEDDDESDHHYLIPSLLSESKLFHKELISQSALFFFKIPSGWNNASFNPNEMILPDDLFAQLLGKIMELSILTAIETVDDNFIFRDLIMIRLGTRIIVLKVFPEANCILLHSLNENILLSFIIILTYILEKVITPYIDFEVVIKKEICYSYSSSREASNQNYYGQIISKSNLVLVLCPMQCFYFKIFPQIIISLMNNGIVPKVVFYDIIKEFNLLPTDLYNFKMVLIIVQDYEDERLFRMWCKNSPLTMFLYNWQNFSQKKWKASSSSGGLEKIKIFKNTNFIGNNVQKFYHTISSLYYGQESSTHVANQITFLSSEYDLFFRSLIYLNGNTYVFKQFPEILSNTKSPAKFIGSIFDDILMLLYPNVSCEDIYDVQKSLKMLECLVLLSSAITTSISINPVESAVLEHKHKKVEEMIERILSSDSMSVEANVLSLLLGENISPLLDSYENSDVMLRKLRAMVFTDSTVMSYISERENEKNMYTLIGSWQVWTVIDKAFWNSSRIVTEKDIGKIDRQSIYFRLRSTSTNCSHLSSNPSLMLFLEFVFSVLYLILVVLCSFQVNEGITKGYLQASLSIMVLGVGLRELGELSDGFYQIYQSQSNTSIIIIFLRTISVYFRDFWNLFDVIGFLSLLSWSILRFAFNSSYSPAVEEISTLALKMSSIPISIGLLRFLVVLKDFGQFIIVVFSMTYDLWRFGLIYIFFLLGFGISLRAIFYEYEEFNYFPNLFLSMFQMSLNTFAYNNFHDYDEYQYVGKAIIVLMVLSVTIVLLNAIIAKFSITFKDINDNVLGVWAINKARYISRYLHNRNPALMLPPPLNTVIFVIFLVMRILHWVCNVIVFMIPLRLTHNWWYAHADMIKECSIGICSAISSTIISLILLLFCASVETWIFLSKTLRKWITSTINSNNITGCISNLEHGQHASVILHFIRLVFLALVLFVNFVFRIILFAILILLMSFLLIIAVPFLVLYFCFSLLYDILFTIFSNISFLYHQVILMSFFLTKEGRDIWDIQGPKVLEKMKVNLNEVETNVNDKDSKVEENLKKKLYTISRIEWFYNHFSPERSLRYIYDEDEYGLGKEFLWEIIIFLRMGAENISDKESKSVYDVKTMKEANDEEMLFTPKDIERIFEKEGEINGQSIDYLKHHLNMISDRMQEAQTSNEESFNDLKNFIAENILEATDYSDAILNSTKPFNQPNKFNCDESELELPKKNDAAYVSYFYEAISSTNYNGTYASKFSAEDKYHIVY